MASGVASPWGFSNKQVAGIGKSLDYNNTHLTGQLSLTSIPPKFKDNDMISPLMNTNFGKKKSLKKIDKEIVYLKSV